MNAGVRLVHSYLTLSGYFTITELPVLRQLRHGGYDQITDLDILGVRFRHAEYVVPRGRPGPSDDLRMLGDEALIDGDHVPDIDVIIAEVKEGKPRINETLLEPAALETALRRVGCVPERLMGRSVEGLRTRGEAQISAEEGHGSTIRIRIIAFGDGREGEREGYHVISLEHVARFVERHLDRYHQVLNPADLGDTPLGLLHLLRKLK